MKTPKNLILVTEVYTNDTGYQYRKKLIGIQHIIEAHESNTAEWYRRQTNHLPIINITEIALRAAMVKNICVLETLDQLQNLINHE